MRRTVSPLLLQTTKTTPFIASGRATFRSISQSQQSLKDVDPIDPSKEGSETIKKAKDEGGATPAQQQANIVKQEMGSSHAQTQPDLSNATKNVNVGEHKDGGTTRDGSGGSGTK